MGSEEVGNLCAIDRLVGLRSSKIQFNLNYIGDLISSLDKIG